MVIRKLDSNLILVLIFFISIVQFTGCREIEVSADKNVDEIIPDNLLSYSPIFKFNLPNELDETSGLIYFNSGFYSHNDSDGEAKLYRFDSLTGSINQQVSISNVSNIDWEDLAQDENYIYIGDFGNNAGNRTDLKIYKIQKSSIPESGDVQLSSESIAFSFEDQNAFNEAFRNNDYDCEAMFSYGDSLYLFSKNWINQKSRLYVLPKIAGTYQARLVSEFDAACLITGAAINSNATEIALIGYVKDIWVPVIWILKDFNDAQFLGGTKLKFELFSILNTQTEGIAYTDDDKLFVSGEKTNLSNQVVFRIDKARKNTTKIIN